MDKTNNNSWFDNFFDNTFNNQALVALALVVLGTAITPARNTTVVDRTTNTIHFEVVAGSLVGPACFFLAVIAAIVGLVACRNNKKMFTSQIIITAIEFVVMGIVLFNAF